MAKHKSFKSVDDMGFDSQLNIPSFDYPEKRATDDRKPATKAAKDFARGVGTGIWDASRSDSFIRKTLKQALPQGYGSALDLADQTGQSLKSLYDSSAREVKPLLNDMKRATGKLMPAASKILPKAVSDRLKRWADTYDGGSSGVSAEYQRDQTLQATLGDIFKYQAETGAQQRAEDKAEADIRHQMQNNKDNMQLMAFNSMRIALQRLVDYQDKVTVNYQRKSLEVQYRQYFVSLDSLQHQKESAVKTKELLENIQKNTGLPDMLKFKAREDFPTLIRNKFFSSIGQSLMGSNSQFMQKLTASITNSIQNQVKGFVTAAQMGITGMEMGMDAANSMGEDGPSTAEMVGGMAGTHVANGVGGWAGRKLGNALRRSKYGKQIQKGSNGLEYVTGNVPQHLMELAMSDKGNDLPFIGGAVRWGKERIKEANSTPTGIERDTLRSLQDPAIFNGFARKSLTEVIPGYLARIYQELQIMRTGNAKIDMTTYDPTSGKFKSRADTGKAIYNTLFPQGTRAMVGRSADSLIQELEKGSGQKISPELRKAVLETLSEDNKNRRLGSPERLSNARTYFNRKHYQHGFDMAGLFKDYFRNDEDGSKKMRFQKLMTGMASGMTNQSYDIQGLINAGYGDYVSEMGLLDKTGNYIDMTRHQDLYTDGSYDPQAHYADGGVRAFGQAPSAAATGMNVKYGRGRGIGHRVKGAVQSGLNAAVANIKLGNRTRNVKNTDNRKTVTYGGNTYYVDRKGNVISKVENTSHDNRQDNRSYDRQDNRRYSSHDGRSYNSSTSTTDSHDQYSSEIHNHINSVVNHIVNEAEKRFSVSMGGAKGYGQVKGGAGITPAQETRLQEAQRRRNDRHAKKRRGPVGTNDNLQFSSNEANFLGKDAIVSAIEANSTKKATEQMLEVLQDIRKKMDDGVKIFHMRMAGRFNGLGQKVGEWGQHAKDGFEQARGKAMGLYQMTVGDALAAGWQGVKSAKNFVTGLPGKAWDKGKEGWEKSKNLRESISKMATSGRQKAVTFANRWDDIYVPGKKEPALYAWKLRAGHYRDRKTGDRIHSYADIKGTIEDVYDNNNVVLDERDIKYAYTIGGGKKLISALGAKVSKYGKMALDWWNNSGSVFDYIPKAIEWGKKAVDLGVHFLDQPMDIYVKGKSDPVLLAVTMKAGGYISTLTGKPIYRPGEIDGPVMDRSMPKNPKLVLSRDDLAGGLYDWQGKRIRTAGQKVWDALKAPVLKIKGMVNDGLTFATNLIKKPFEAVGQFFFNWFGRDGIIFSGSKTMIERLTEIRDLLKDRLPAPKKRRGSWQDQEDQKKQAATQAQGAASVTPGGGGIFSTLSNLGAGLKGLFGHFKKQDDKDQAATDKDNKEKNKSLLDKGKDFVVDKAKDAAEGYAWSKGSELATKHTKKLSKKALEKLAKKKGLGKLGALATLLADAEEIATAKDKGKAVIKTGKDAVESYAGEQAGKLAGKKLFGKFIERQALKTAATTGVEAATGLGATAAAGGAEAAAGGALAAGAEGTIAGLGLELGLGSALAAGLGIAATAAAAILTSPVVLGAAAVGVAYYGMKASARGVRHLMSAKVLPLEAVRMAQYGFLADDWEHINAIREFEENMLKHVVYDEHGKASLDKKKFSVEEAFGPFDLDKNNKQDLRSWLQWFSLRFKPVFLTALTALKGVNQKATLKKVDKSLSKEEKLKYLDAVANPSGPYTYMTSPFHTWHFLFLHGGDGLKAGRKEVAAAVEAAKKAIEKESDLPGKISKFGSGIMDGILGRAPEKGKDGKEKPLTTSEKIARGIGKVLKYTPVGLVAMGVSWLSDLFSGKKKDDPKKTGKPIASVGISPTLTKISNKVDALESLRFRTYGLVQLESDKVNALKALEDACLPFIASAAKLNDYQVHFTGDPHDILKQVGASFGVSGTHNTVAYRWVSWFMRRFLPTYLTYVGSLMKATGKKDIHQTTFEPMVASKIAPLIIASKSPEGKSVWEITDSPWANYDLNTDQKSVTKIVDYLSDKVSVKTLNDGVTDKTKTKDSAKSADKKPKSVEAGDGGKGWTNLLSGKGVKEKWDEIKSWGKGVWDKGVSTVKNLYNAGKEKVGKVVSGVGDSMKGFGASLGKAYKAVTGNAKQIKDAALAALTKAGITNPTEQAMFMAQMDHESGGFKSLSENLNYKPSVLDRLFGGRLREAGVSSQDLASQGAEAIANVIYGGKFGRKMGNTDPGDGFKYRGRGIVQLTGKANYEKYGKMIGVDLISNPDLAADPKVAAQLAVAYWKDRVPSSAAQAGDVSKVTYAVNGGQNGLSDRQAKFQQYLQEAKAGKLGGDNTTQSGPVKTADGKPVTGAAGVGTVSSGAPVTTSSAPTSDKPATAAPATAPSTTVASTGSASPAVQTNAPSGDSSATESKPKGAKMYGGGSSSAPDNNPFGFGLGSAQSMTRTPAQHIAAVQQAQHEDKMATMGNMGDVLNKQLGVQSESRDVLKSIYAMLADIQKGQTPDKSSAAPAANTSPAPSKQMQPMVNPPVSMGKMV